MLGLTRAPQIPTYALPEKWVEAQAAPSAPMGGYGAHDAACIKSTKEKRPCTTLVMQGLSIFSLQSGIKPAQSRSA
jgi:hypothetical protein